MGKDTEENGKLGRGRPQGSWLGAQGGLKDIRDIRPAADPIRAAAGAGGEAEPPEETGAAWTREAGGTEDERSDPG